jgi:hypothetical protein
VAVIWIGDGLVQIARFLLGLLVLVFAVVQRLFRNQVAVASGIPGRDMGTREISWGHHPVLVAEQDSAGQLENQPLALLDHKSPGMGLDTGMAASDKGKRGMEKLVA